MRTPEVVVAEALAEVERVLRRAMGELVGLPPELPHPYSEWGLPSQIEALAARAYGIPVAALREKSRRHEVIEARHRAIYLMRQVAQMSIGAISRRLDFDRDAVRAAVAKVARLRESNPIEEEWLRQAEVRIQLGGGS